MGEGKQCLLADTYAPLEDGKTLGGSYRRLVVGSGLTNILCELCVDASSKGLTAGFKMLSSATHVSSRTLLRGDSSYQLTTNQSRCNRKLMTLTLGASD